MSQRIRVPLGLRTSPGTQLARPAMQSCIGPGVRFEGTFCTSGGLSVHGQLHGVVARLPGHSCEVIVHEHATAEAVIEADLVEIHGLFKGQIDNPRGTVVLGRTGELVGEVRAGKLIVSTGIIDADIGVSQEGQ